MPQYMLLIYTPADARPSPEEMQAEMPKWGEYTEALRSSGAMSAGDALHGTETATTVRVRDGETVVSDGPFAETKEVLGGYYVIDVRDLDEALKWAAKIPSAPRGSVEVRPVMVFDEQGRPVSEAGARA
ncbi:MAG TPA: YciI family protein [Thermoleophilaceae bacterium]